MIWHKYCIPSSYNSSSFLVLNSSRLSLRLSYYAVALDSQPSKGPKKLVVFQNLCPTYSVGKLIHCSTWIVSLGLYAGRVLKFSFALSLRMS
jgi:hypothetical protein